VMHFRNDSTATMVFTARQKKTYAKCSTSK
jgi:hypothetical protein